MKTVDCPKCGSTLTLSDEVEGIVECHYCNAEVQLDRPKAAPDPWAGLPPQPSARKSTSGVWIVVAVFALSFVGVGIAFFFEQERKNKVDAETADYYLPGHQWCVVDNNDDDALDVVLLARMRGESETHRVAVVDGKTGKPTWVGNAAYGSLFCVSKKWVFFRKKANAGLYLISAEDPSLQASVVAEGYVREIALGEDCAVFTTRDGAYPVDLKNGSPLEECDAKPVDLKANHPGSSQDNPWEHADESYRVHLKKERTSSRIKVAAFEGFTEGAKGEQTWVRRLEIMSVKSAPSVLTDDLVVVIGRETGGGKTVNMVALDRETGEDQFVVPVSETGTWFSGGLFYNGRHLVVLGGGGRDYSDLQAYNPKNGKLVWKLLKVNQ